ncbi:MAG TPA: hypothetical protein VEI57_11360 [Nitrospirota bacterium]|nr:hypothetical protein [Nitrospirota bacterium]
MARTLSVTFFPINLAIHKFSFWAIYKAGHYKVTGPEVRQAVDAARPGDDLLCRYDGHLDKGFTSFRGTFCTRYRRNSARRFIGQSSMREDIDAFFWTGSSCLLRLNGETPDEITDAYN